MIVEQKSTFSLNLTSFGISLTSRAKNTLLFYIAMKYMPQEILAAVRAKYRHQRLAFGCKEVRNTHFISHNEKCDLCFINPELLIGVT